jgi:serine/threonine-protein kinase RsbW
MERTVELPSESGETTRIVDEIIEVAQRLDWPERDRYAIQMALVEALANAVKHGNGGDPLRLIRATYRIDAERVWIEIEDEGAGFSLDEVPDPTKPAQWEATSGRGIFLMRAYMTSVEYFAAGAGVRMERCREQRTPSGVRLDG